MQLLATKSLDIDGKARSYFSGEWVEVGKQTALGWIARGEARACRPVEISLPAGSGALLTGEGGRGRALLAKVKGLAIEQGEPGIPFERTLIWDGLCDLRIDLVGVGLGYLERWQAALAIAGYGVTAAELGTQEERERTAAVIHDLRAPVYEPGAMFLRKCPETERLVDLWREEISGGEDGRLALLRALYRSRVSFNPLPATWVGR